MTHKKRRGGEHSTGWVTCQRCGIRWETRLEYFADRPTCADCRLVDPKFGKRVQSR